MNDGLQKNSRYACSWEREGALIRVVLSHGVHTILLHNVLLRSKHSRSIYRTHSGISVYFPGTRGYLGKHTQPIFRDLGLNSQCLYMGREGALIRVALIVVQSMMSVNV